MTYSDSSDEDEVYSVDCAPLVASLAQVAEAYLPYVAGMMTLPSTAFEFYYKDRNGTPRYVRKSCRWVSPLIQSCSAMNFASASDEQLNALMQACEPASFGRGGEDVLDESYRKAGKLDATAFSTPLVPERTDLARIVHDFLLAGENNKLDIVMELYKLNVYGTMRPLPIW